MLVHTIMSRRVVALEMDDSLAEAEALFSAAPFHHALVMDEGHLVGVISDRDIWRALSPYLGSQSENQRDRDTLARRVHQVMSRQVITVTPQASLEAAAALLLEHGISCLPVVEQERVVGILTWRDLLRALLPGIYPGRD